MPTPEVFPTGNGEWCWRLRNGWNKQIVCVGGETFTKKHSAAQAYRRVFGISKDGKAVTPPLHNDIVYTDN